MARGHIERLRSGRYRAKVYAGLDPVTRRQRYLRGEARDTESGAVKDLSGLLAQAEAERVPDKAATVGLLLGRWMEVAELEYSTRHANQGYIDRTLRPVLGDVQVRKLRADTLDVLYTHLRRCGRLCNGRPFVEHKTSREHDCAKQGCTTHECRPMAAGTVRRIHAMLSAALNMSVSRSVWNLGDDPW